MLYAFLRLFSISCKVDARAEFLLSMTKWHSCQLFVWTKNDIILTFLLNSDSSFYICNETGEAKSISLQFGLPNALHRLSNIILWQNTAIHKWKWKNMDIKTPSTKYRLLIPILHAPCRDSILLWVGHEMSENNRIDVTIEKARQTRQRNKNAAVRLNTIPYT